MIVPPAVCDAEKRQTGCQTQGSGSRGYGLLCFYRLQPQPPTLTPEPLSAPAPLRPVPQPRPVELSELPQVQLTLRERRESSSHSACGNSGREKNSFFF